MQLRVDSFNITQGNGLVKQLLVEWRGEAAVQAVAVEHGDPQRPADEVEVGQVVRVHACNAQNIDYIWSDESVGIRGNSPESGLICSV